VPNAVDSIVVTPTLQDSNASFAFTSSPGTCTPPVGGPATCALNEGANQITATVTAQNGTTTNTYVLNMRRDLPADPHRANVVALGHGPTADHYCVVLEDGQLLCWGENPRGQVGDGTTVDQSKPYTVPNISDAMQVGMGVYSTCILRRSGTVHCWGSGSVGQLGSGNTSKSSSPTDVVDSAGGTPLSGVAALAVGTLHACAIVPNGVVRCWGLNVDGQLGNGTYVDSSVPMTVEGLPTSTQVVAGNAFSCALAAVGTVHCWGAKANVGLGEDGPPYNGISVPVTVVTTLGGSPLTNVVAIRADADNMCARTSADTQY